MSAGQKPPPHQRRPMRPPHRLSEPLINQSPNNVMNNNNNNNQNNMKNSKSYTENLQLVSQEFLNLVNKFAQYKLLPIHYVKKLNVIPLIYLKCNTLCNIDFLPFHFYLVDKNVSHKKLINIYSILINIIQKSIIKEWLQCQISTTKRTRERSFTKKGI